MPKKFNKATANKYRLTAKRTLKIIDLIEQGLSDGEIVRELRVERSLVFYYRKQLFL
jgi:DNA-binding NarL/FixJ family response regulator